MIVAAWPRLMRNHVRQAVEDSQAVFRTITSIAVLVAGIVLLLAGVLRAHPILFVAGNATWVLAVILLGRGAPRSRSTALSTPAMSDLVSDVREQDRALRDGVWVEEYAMRDSGPRRIVGTAILVIAGLVLQIPAYFVLVRVAGNSRLLVAIAVTAVVFTVASVMAGGISGSRRSNRTAV